MPKISQPVSLERELMRICGVSERLQRREGAERFLCELLSYSGRRETDERSVADCSNEAVDGEGVRVRLQGGISLLEGASRPVCSLEH